MGRHVRRLSARWKLLAAGALAGSALGGAALLPSTSAGFSGSTDHPAASWTAGTVALSHSSTAGSTLSLAGVKPGSRTSACIDVTYTGNVASITKLYATGYVSTDAVAGPGQLAGIVQMSIYQANSGTCSTGVTAWTTIFGGTLATLGTTATSYPSGLGTWNPANRGAVQAYLITVLIRGDNAAQGDAAAATLTWEARNA
ncbi:hypothetical protein [Actinoplanes sp. NPDC051859]|uniref:hypothetical protein n=1 Tax=Actinoplanes sp. NPDC051859 TaxID=3363909 RepID=UPI003798A786